MRNIVKLLFMGVSFFIYFSLFEFALESYLTIHSSPAFITGVVIAGVLSFVLAAFSSDKLMAIVEGNY